jgi:hypothetical protein
MTLVHACADFQQGQKVKLSTNFVYHVLYDIERVFLSYNQIYDVFNRPDMGHRVYALAIFAL